MTTARVTRTRVAAILGRAPDDLRVAAMPWVVSRVLVLGALGLARFIGDELHATGTHHLQLGQGLFSWDAAYYRDIAQHGYASVQHANGLRFFPLVPLLARGLGVVFLGHTAAALIVVTNVGALAFAALLHRLVLREWGDRALARRAVWLGLLAPPAMVLVTGYAESVLMALSVAVFLALRSRRWEWAALAGLLAGLTRPSGVLLVLPAAIEAARGWRAAKPRELARRVGAVVAPVVGAGIYLAWVEGVYGDGFLPMRLQQDPKLRGGWVEPVGRLVDAARDLFGGDRFGSGLHFVWALLFIGLVVVAVRRLPASYSAFAGVSVLVSLSAHNLDSFERYGLAAFPLVIAAALVVGRDDVERPVLVCSAAGLVGYAALGFLGISIP